MSEKTYKIAIVALMIPEGSSSEDFMDELSDYRDDNPQRLLQWDQVLDGKTVHPSEKLDAGAANHMWQYLTGDDRGPAPVTHYSVEQLWEFYRKAQSVTEYHTGTPLKFLRSGSIPLICRDSPETTYRVEVDHGTLDSDGTVTLWEALDGPNPPRSLVVRFLKHTSPEFL